MASWELFHLANVSEVPAPVRARDATENGRSTPCSSPVWVGQHADPAAVHSLLSANWKLRSRKQHSPRLTHHARKAQGYREWMLSRQGGREAASLSQSISKIWLPGRALLHTCMHLCTMWQQLLMKTPQFPSPLSFSPVSWTQVGKLVTVWRLSACSYLPIGRLDSGL